MASDSEPDYELRKVRLPIEKLDKCAVCSKTTTLRFCSSCLQCIYCSKECQKDDWPNHKKICKLTDCIELSTFYPFLACLAASAHLNPAKPINPAVIRAILNNPNPGTSGSLTNMPRNLIMLGQEITMEEMSSPKWWPTAITPSVRSKLFRRLCCEGYNLEILTAICVALLAEMYSQPMEESGRNGSTPTGGPGSHIHRRTILRYKSSPIADFGIVKGEANVTEQDTFTYFLVSDDGSPPKTWNGQDPKDHYWLYFRTTRGEEITLDFAMYTFNFCYVLDSQPYLEPCAPPLSFVPAFIRDREIDRQAPSLYTEKGRISVLRNTALHGAITNIQDRLRPAQTKTIWNFIEAFSGKELSQADRQLTIIWLMGHCVQLESMLQRRSWKSYPKQPQLAIEGDPGELDDPGPLDSDEDWLKFLHLWKKQHKKGGKTTKEDVARAFQAFKANKRH